MKKKVLSDLLTRCRAVIFDMDGVLVDSEPIHAQSFRVFLKKLKVPFPESFIDDLVGYSIDHNINTINQTFLTEKPLDISEGVKARDAIYVDLLKKVDLKPLAGVEPLIQFCLKRKIRLALASSSVREQVDLILNNLSGGNSGLLDFSEVFDVTVSGDEVKQKKPAPDVYRRALELLDVQAADCLAIEDSEAGILSAHANGIFCFALRNQYLKEEIAQQADQVIDSIEEIFQLMEQNGRHSSQRIAGRIQ